MASPHASGNNATSVQWAAVRRLRKSLSGGSAAPLPYTHSNDEYSKMAGLGLLRSLLIEKEKALRC